jgi:hypothetical protein
MDSSVFSPIPSTAVSSPALPKPPLASRYSTIACAFALPMPDRLCSSSTLAELTSTSAQARVASERRIPPKRAFIPFMLSLLLP